MALEAILIPYADRDERLQAQRQYRRRLAIRELEDLIKWAFTNKLYDDNLPYIGYEDLRDYTLSRIEKLGEEIDAGLT